MHVLIVDDESLILNLCKRILQKNSHTAYLAETAADGITLCRAHKSEIEAAIVDLSLEGMSGFSIIVKLREIIPYLPCIISSGHIVDEEDIPEELKENSYILQKPYRPHELLEILETIMVSNS